MSMAIGYRLSSPARLAIGEGGRPVETAQVEGFELPELLRIRCRASRWSSIPARQPSGPSSNINWQISRSVVSKYIELYQINEGIMAV